MYTFLVNRIGKLISGATKGNITFEGTISDVEYGVLVLSQEGRTRVYLRVDDISWFTEGKHSE